MKNQRGFSAVEAFLILVIVGLLGFTGYYVYNSQSSANQTYDKVQKLASSEDKPLAQLTSDWVSYSSKTQNYSLKHPKDWASSECDAVLLLAATPQYLGKCNSDSAGQMTTGALNGDYRTQLDTTKSAACQDPTSQGMTINGVDGYKYGCTVAAGQAVGPAAGTRSTAYVFYTGGKTYVFNYFNLAGAPDASTDFNLMVTKTLKFSS